MSATARADGESVAFGVLAGGSMVAGGLVAAVDSAVPFAHGSWLAAYLVLVGGVGQAVLGLGHHALPGAHPPAALRRAQLALFATGDLLVPAGVLAALPALVAVGSVLVLGALGCFWHGARTPRRTRGAVAAGYDALVVCLALGALVGLGLTAA